MSVNLLHGNPRGRLLDDVIHKTLTKRQDLRRHVNGVSRTQVAHYFEWPFKELIRRYLCLKAEFATPTNIVGVP